MFTYKNDWIPTSSSHITGNEPNLSFDGDTGTSFITSEATLPFEWLQIDFIGIHAVTMVQIMVDPTDLNARNQLSSLEVRVGAFDVASAMAGERRAIVQNHFCFRSGETPPKDSWDYFFCPGYVDGRYLTVQKMTNIPDGQLHIAEIEVQVVEKWQCKSLIEFLIHNCPRRGSEVGDPHTMEFSPCFVLHNKNLS